MIINNKEILQSYILTTAKYDYSVYEKRILYRMLEIFQQLTKGAKLNEKIFIQTDLYDVKIFTIPLAQFLVNEEDRNHAFLKKALISLSKKTFEYEDDKVWEQISIISEPVIKKYDKSVRFRINPRVVEAFLDFSKGFRKYELKIAMEFESIYSMRFYELFSNQKTPINYSIENLKNILKIEGKYKLTADFIRRIIEPTKKELDNCSPYTFNFETIKEGKKITGIRFIPIYQPQFEDEEIKKQRLNKEMSNRWYISKNIEDYLIHNFEFTKKELNNNLNLFEALYNKISEDELLDFLVSLRENSIYADNQKAFIIGALKKKNEQLFEQIYIKS